MNSSPAMSAVVTCPACQKEIIVLESGRFTCACGQKIETVPHFVQQTSEFAKEVMVTAEKVQRKILVWVAWSVGILIGIIGLILVAFLSFVLK